MQTKPKANSVITHETDGRLIRFNVAGAGTLVLDMEKVSPENRNRATIHGFVQRVSDGAAKTRDPVTFKAAPASDKFAAMKAIVDHLESGTSEWRLAGAERGPSGAKLLAQALSAKYPTRSAEQIQSFVEARTAKQVRAMLDSEELREIVAKLQPKVEGGNELLKEFESL